MIAAAADPTPEVGERVIQGAEAVAVHDEAALRERVTAGGLDPAAAEKRRSGGESGRAEPPAVCACAARAKTVAKQSPKENCILNIGFPVRGGSEL